MDSKVRKLVMGGLLAAITCVCTLAVRIPVPGTHGYVNFGDGVLMMAGLLFGPQVGFAAGAIGSALADISGGYAVYAPATFIVKGCEALIVALIAHKGFKEKPLSIRTFAGLAAGGVLLVGGYFAADWLMFGLPAAIAGVAANCGQAVAGAVIALAAGTPLRRAVH